MDYIAPRRLGEALALLAKWKTRAKLVAGCTNVLPDLRARTAEVDLLIDLSVLKNLSFIKEERRRIRVGALTPVAELGSSKVIRNEAPLLYEAARHLGNPLVRNRATLGGNLADASPAADMAVPLLALEASLVTDRSRKRGREIPIDQFFLGPNKTVLKPDEIIKEIFFSKPDPSMGWAYTKLGLRNAMAISVISIAVLVQMDKDRCRKVRISLGAVAPTPIRTYQTEALLMDQRMEDKVMEACCRKIEAEVKPISDIRASAEYRRSMASVLLRRSFEKIRSRGNR